MAAVTSLSFSALSQCSERKLTASSTRFLGSNSEAFQLRTNFPYQHVAVRASNSVSRMVVQCMSSVTDDYYRGELGDAPVVASLAAELLQKFEHYFSLKLMEDVPPTVSETKLNFLKAYRQPIPSIYNTVLQELMVQQHLMRYKRSYRYDPVFALGFVTVYDQLMEGYPSDEDREAIFQAYINALKEDPEQYRIDAQKLEEWARAQNPTSLVDFSSRDGKVEAILKDIAQRASGKGDFSYSRFFAVGLFRLLELTNATEPTILEKLCAALNIDKRSVDRDLDVYRNLLSKLVQAKELLKEYVDREKKKREERSESQKANETVTKFLGQQQFSGL